MSEKISILKNTIEQMASDADDKGQKDFGLRLTVDDAFALCRLEDAVHCKDCAHWLKDAPGCTDFVGYCEFAHWMIGQNGYCIYGEQKGGAE